MSQEPPPGDYSDDDYQPPPAWQRPVQRKSSPWLFVLVGIALVMLPGFCLCGYASFVMFQVNQALKQTAEPLDFSAEGEE